MAVLMSSCEEQVKCDLPITEMDRLGLEEVVGDGDEYSADSAAQVGEHCHYAAVVVG